MAPYKYSNEQLREAVAVSDTFASVIRFLGGSPSGGLHAHIKRRIEALGLCTTHFVGSGWNTNGPRRRGGTRKKTMEEVFVVRSRNHKTEGTHILRRALRELGRIDVCSVCGQIPVWNGKPLTLEIDHINGNKYDNRAENLRFICPNCHSQTETFRAKNRMKRGPKEPTITNESQELPNRRKPRLDQRKVERPEAQELGFLINCIPMTEIAKKYGVSDNAVRKWVRAYELPLPHRRGYWAKQKSLGR